MSGVSAMAAANTSAAVESSCRQHSWPLSLEPGQNQFTIAVTASQVRYMRICIAPLFPVITARVIGSIIQFSRALMTRQLLPL